MKKFLLIFMSLILALTSFASCGRDENTDTQSTTTANTTEATTAATTAEPEDTRIHVNFDDRITLKELIGKDADSYEIKNEVVTSKKVGTDTADSAVLKYDVENKRFIAVGTGTLTIVAGGEEYEVVVDPAPISFVMITGHSLGMGSQGNAAQSVLCEEGQVYFSDLSSDLRKAKGISYECEEKPKLINCLTDGTGYQGVDGGLANRWNQLTGEKIWVLNTAIGGSCINEWVEGQINSLQAMSNFEKVAGILKNEVAAGHYLLKDISVIYFSAANFDYKGVKFDDQKISAWYDSLWKALTDTDVDIDGDGTADKAKSLGFVPLWQPGTTQHINKFNFDKPTTFYLSASKDHPYAFTASNISREWMTAGSSLSAIFPAIKYETASKEVKHPTKIEDVVADTAHLTQLGYNAYGIDIAENLYSYLRTDNLTESVTFYNTSGSAMKALSMKVGNTTTVNIVSKQTSAGNFDITVSDNLEYKFPGSLTAKSAGKGTITVSQNGKVVGTLEITVS